MFVYGINSVSEALGVAKSSIRRIVVGRGKGGGRIQEIIRLAKSKGVPVSFEPVDALDRKAKGQKHQGVIAEISEVEYSSLKEILTGGPKLLLLVDGVEDPRNLGAVLRTAEAAGVDGVLLPHRHTCGITPAAVKTSAGAAMHLKVCRIGNVAQTLAQLKKEGFWTVGLDIKGEEGFSQLNRDLPLVLVVGGEDRGLRRLVRQNCDFLIRLPILGNVSSLNLSVAAGIAIYAVKLGWGKGSED
jgi:23S rRNA (guanosine2251-2'-O)-methyltransferase